MHAWGGRELWACVSDWIISIFNFVTVTFVTFTQASVYPQRMMNTSHKAPRFCVVLIFFSPHQNNKSESAKKTQSTTWKWPLCSNADTMKTEDSLLLSRSNYSSFSCEAWVIFYFNVLHFFHVWQAHAVWGTPQANPRRQSHCQSVSSDVGRAENKSRNSILVIALPQLMRDDEMKKRGITENNGDWGSLRLPGLGFNHPATPPLLYVPTQTQLIQPTATR